MTPGVAPTQSDKPTGRLRWKGTSKLQYEVAVTLYEDGWAIAADLEWRDVPVVPEDAEDS